MSDYEAVKIAMLRATDEIERLRAQVDRLTREITEADGAVLRARNEHKQAEARAERLAGLLTRVRELFDEPSVDMAIHLYDGLRNDIDAALREGT